MFVEVLPRDFRTFTHCFIARSSIKNQKKNSISFSVWFKMTFCLFSGLAWFPAVTATFGVLAMIVPYSVGYKYDQLSSKLPFISDAGSRAPASTYFTFLIVSFAFCFMMTAFIRFSHVRGILGHNKSGIQWANVLSLLLAIIGTIGLNLIASFQESVNFNVHIIGFCMALGLAPFYCFLQLYLSQKLASEGHFPKNKVLFVFRLFLMIVSGVGFLVCSMLFLFEGYTYLYEPEEDEETLYYTCSGAEWAATAAFILFLLTLAKEFSAINVTIFVEVLNGHVNRDETV